MKITWKYFEFMIVLLLVACSDKSKDSFELGKIAYDSSQYTQAKILFLQVDSLSQWGEQARLYLSRIDSLTTLSRLDSLANLNTPIESEYDDGLLISTYEIKTRGHKLVDYYTNLFASNSQEVESDGGGGEHTSFGYSLKEFKDYKLLVWKDNVIDQSFEETTFLFQNDSLLAVWSCKKGEYSNAYVESLEEFKGGKITTVDRSLEGAGLDFYEVKLNSLAFERTPFRERTEPGSASNHYMKFAEQVLHFKNLVSEWNLAIQEQNSYDSASYQ